MERTVIFCPEVRKHPALCPLFGTPEKAKKRAKRVHSKALGAVRASEWTAPAIEDAVRALPGSREIPAKQALLALRAAVTGRTVSPPLFETMYLLGRERTLARLGRW
ncbi:MAG: hypothetical protein M3Y81_04800 [Chloroflexota bacterium]|nr:hypothetical protein [Chloroflexota bacterium]